MIHDIKHRFDSERSLSNGTSYSTDVYDDGQDRNLGIGEPMGVVITVHESAYVMSGSGTFTFEVQTDDNEDFGTPVAVCTREIPGSKLKVNTIHVLPLPFDPVCERYLRMKYVLAGSSPTIKISSFPAPLNSIHQYVTYASPITIS